MESASSDLKSIGPSFSDELARKGLLGEHFSWRPNGEIEFFDDTPEHVQSEVMAVYAQHNPAGD
ncbi:hypothetical protein WJ973_23585 [Achromobacter xylosoxidans]